MQYILEVSECDSHPCMNSGICLDGISEYSCDCSGTGSEGPQCEIGKEFMYTKPE